jgi:hypothetical protein
MRRRSLAALVSLTALVAAVPAAAKDGVRAKLDKPVNLSTKPGQEIHVAWHLLDRHGNNFGARDIYLRVSRCGRPLIRVRATQAGDGYHVVLRVPRGGIRTLAVGLQGIQIRRGHKPRRADPLFPFAPPLRRRCS